VPSYAKKIRGLIFEGGWKGKKISRDHTGENKSKQKVKR
jgi:hypothetical protein